MAYRTSDTFIVDKGSDNLCKEHLMWSIYERVSFDMIQTFGILGMVLYLTYEMEL